MTKRAVQQPIKLYTVKLTARQLYLLSIGFDTSFDASCGDNKEEREISEKLVNLYRKVQKQES